MAGDVTEQLRMSSQHFKNLLSSLPKQLASGDDADQDNDQRVVTIHSEGQSRIDLQEKLQAKLITLGKKASTEKDREKLRMKRKLKKERKKQKTKKPKTENNSKEGSEDKSKIVKDSKAFNIEGSILFSKLEVGDSAVAKKKKKTRGLPTGKNYKMMLEKVEKQKGKIQKLEENDTEAAKVAKEKLLWKKVLAKADGVKVKDSEDYLRSALKKKEKLKQKRKTQWKIRDKDVKKKIFSRQEKRKENIDKKKQARFDKKIKRARKRGRVVFKD